MSGLIYCHYFYVILPVIIVFSFIAFCSTYWTKDKIKFVTTITTTLTKFAKGIFGGKTGEMSSEVEKEKWGVPLTYILGKEVPCPIIGYIGVQVLSLCLYTVLAFWVTFLIEKSSNCDSESDCFMDGGGNDPVDNCTEILMKGDNITFTCYKYVSDIGMAISVSGCTITALGLISSALATFWLFWYDLIKEGCTFFFCVLQYIIGLFVPVIFVLVTLVILQKYLESLQIQHHVIIQVGCMIVTFFMGSTFSWSCFSQDSD